MPDIVDVGEAQQIADRLMAVLSTPIRLADADVTVRASIGIDITTADHMDPDTVQRNADNAMYMAKGAGKSCYATYDPCYTSNSSTPSRPPPPRAEVSRFWSHRLLRQSVGARAIHAPGPARRSSATLGSRSRSNTKTASCSDSLKAPRPLSTWNDAPLAGVEPATHGLGTRSDHLADQGRRRTPW